jgi:hypothetical protein
MPVRSGAPDNTEPVFLIELPGLRLDSVEARQARQRVPGVDVEILSAVSLYETWIYLPAQPSLELDGSEGFMAFLSAILSVDESDHPEFRVRKLHRLHTLGDSARGSRQRWHYTSQTDIPAGMEDEFNRWFDNEHLPQLAAVPGTAHATRYRTDGSPRYLACYDLSRQEVHGGPAWRDAVSTPWRDRIHQAFLNPRRLMLERL